MKKTLEKENSPLPSVSKIALNTNNNAFCILASTIISLRTKDKITLEASNRLFKLATSPKELLKLDTEDIEKAIYPCAFYKRKTENLIKISNILCNKFDSKVPDNTNDLLSLPGVGIKTANLTLNLAFNIEAICVDCHVHQIANRMGWINTSTAQESEKALQEIMPRKYWIILNELLVSYGQEICTSISPKCSKCNESSYCPKIGVTTSR
ncbi:MAG: endonuclease III [Sphaerochaetaceae bacterium]|nr:endonuclease III [Sphaerochaetaceae bacterium]